MEIEVHGLWRRFGPVAALRDLGFRIPRGRRVALIGPNGSGKSTLNRVLMGMLRFEGEVRIDGRSPLDERAEIARRMAYVPQIAPSFGVPVSALLSALVRIRGMPTGRVEAAARRLGLELGPLTGRPFRRLSGGTKQKLLIALALAAEASLLILDEPTGSLDAATRERFFPLFDALDPETTLLLCSHRLEEVRQLVDHVLVLDEGRLVYDGPVGDFLDSSTTAVVEVCVEGEAACRWLEARGFRRGTGNWWLRTVSQTEKLALLPALAGELRGALRDLNVRDLEWLQLGSQRTTRRDGDGA